MSTERSRLPEVASVEGAWMRAATLPAAAVTSRGGALGETDWQHYFGAVRRRKWTLQTAGRVVQTDSLDRPVGQGEGGGLGFSWSPRPGLVAPGHSIDFVLSTPADAARQFMKTLSVTTDVDPALMRTGTDANFLRIQLTGSQPTELAATVNAIADRVVVVAADLKRIKLVELGRILDEQRQHALRSLRDAEAAQRDLRMRSAGVLRQGAT